MQKISNELTRIGDEIAKSEIENYDCTGKYIYVPEYGYMFVTWQCLDNSHRIYLDDRMFFQGYGFNISTTDYRDDYYVSVDAMKEWYIPIEKFKKCIKEIKVLTKEEFVQAHNDMISKYISDWNNMLEFCEKYEIHDR